MTTSTNTKLPRPDWIDKDPSEWPPEARTLFSILGNIAERRLRRLRAEENQEKETSWPQAAG